MSLILPPADSPLRDLFDVSDLAKLPDAVMRGKLMSLDRSIFGAFESNFGGDGVVSINVLAEFEGNIVLAQISRSSAEVLWNFGSLSQFE